MSRSLTLALVLLAAVCSAATAQAPQLFFAEAIPTGELDEDDNPTYTAQKALKATSQTGTDTRALVTLAQAAGIGWSPDGRWFTFVQTAGDEGAELIRLYAYDCVSEQAVTISAPGQNIAGYWWSDDSTALTYLVPADEPDAYDIYYHDLTPGGQARKVNGDLAAAGAAVVCSSDAGYIAFAVAKATSPGQVAIGNTATGEAWVASGNLRVRRHQWSLAGAKIAFLSVAEGAETADLFVADAESGALTRISNEAEAVEGFAWRPASTDMAYMIGTQGMFGGTEDEPGVAYRRVLLLMASTDTGDTRRVGNVSNASQFVWSGDGRYFAVSDMAIDPLSGAAQPSIKVGTFGDEMRIPELVRNSTGSTIFTWAPDGHALAFMYDDYLYVYDATTRRSSVVVNSLTVRDMVWAPDSKKLAILTPYREGGIVVWCVDVEEGRGRILSNAFKSAGMIDWSPSGESILLYMPTSPIIGAVYTLDPDGDPSSVKLASDKVITATWYPVIY